MPYDSTGKRLEIGNRIRFRGRLYTVTGFVPNAGAAHTARIEVAEPLHVEEQPDETNVDRVAGHCASRVPDDTVELVDADPPRNISLAAVIARMVDAATHDLEGRLDADELDDLGSKWCGDFSAILAAPWSSTPVEPKPVPLILYWRVARAVSHTLTGRRLTTKERNAILAAVATVLDERTIVDSPAPEGRERVAKVGDSYKAKIHVNERVEATEGIPRAELERRLRELERE